MAERGWADGGVQMPGRNAEEITSNNFASVQHRTFLFVTNIQNHKGIARKGGWTNYKKQ